MADAVAHAASPDDNGVTSLVEAAMQAPEPRTPAAVPFRIRDFVLDRVE